jgi:hypothetical protein
MILNKKLIEKKLDKKLRSNVVSVGVDTASRAGICISVVDKEDLHLETLFIDINSKDIYFKYNQLIKSFSSILNVKNPKDYVLVIEDTYFGKNVEVLKMISRMGMIVYMCGHLAGIEDIRFIYPTSSRKQLGIKGTLKKAEVHKELAKILGSQVDDPDIADAIILSLNGLLIENKLM